MLESVAEFRPAEPGDTELGQRGHVSAHGVHRGLSRSRLRQIGIDGVQGDRGAVARLRGSDARSRARARHVRLRHAALQVCSRGRFVCRACTPAEKDGSDLPFTFGPTYNNEMSVEQIVGIMTLEQAKKVVVDDGMSKGMTMGEVAEKRPASLQFYLSIGYKKNNNILKAAAQILLNERKKAS